MKIRLCSYRNRRLRWRGKRLDPERVLETNYPQFPDHELMKKIFNKKSFTTHFKQWQKFVEVLPSLKYYISTIVGATPEKEILPLMRKIMDPEKIVNCQQIFVSN